MNDNIMFIKNAGGCVVSKNIILEKGVLKWCVREKSIDNNDNGWRFFSDLDTDEYLKDANNMMICDFNTVANIEPAVLAIYSLPVGTDIELVISNGRKKFINNNTGNEIKL